MDAQIAEARAQRAKLAEMAAGGDPMAQLLLRRVEAAEREFLEGAVAWIFGSAR